LSHVGPRRFAAATRRCADPAEDVPFEKMGVRTGLVPLVISGQEPFAKWKIIIFDGQIITHKLYVWYIYQHLP